MGNDYAGWQLFEKVIIVAKEHERWVDGNYINDGVQGYIVDPSNKKMLENARRWGKRIEYGEYVPGEGYPNKVEHEPEEYIFDNNDFALELVDCAEGSGQGGKLSFWNCNITKDGKTFLVGIAADLLLDVLKNNTFIDGKCQSPLMFARRKGGVGMLSENMESYKQALADMRLKKKVNTGKTSKHKLGHIYSTLTEKDAYLADLYCWYEPIVEKRDSGWGVRIETVGFRKLAKPTKLKWFAHVDESKTKLSDFKLSSWDFKVKLPARIEGERIIEYDMSVEECINRYVNHEIIDLSNKSLYDRPYIPKHVVGLSTNGEKYIMPLRVREALAILGYRLED